MPSRLLDNALKLGILFAMDSAPVYRGAVGLVVVLDMNHNFITPTGFDQRPGELFIEHLATGLWEPVRGELRLKSCQSFHIKSSTSTGQYSKFDLL